MSVEPAAEPWEAMACARHGCFVRCGGASWQDYAPAMQLRVGDRVGLHFRFRGQDEHGVFFDLENLPVTVRSVTERGYEGELEQDPKHSSDLHAGMVVRFDISHPFAIVLHSAEEIEDLDLRAAHVIARFRRSEREQAKARRWHAPAEAGRQARGAGPARWQERLRGWWLFRVAPWMLLGALGVIVATAAWRESWSPWPHAPVTGAAVLLLAMILLRSAAGYLRPRPQPAAGNETEWWFFARMIRMPTLAGMRSVDWSEFAEVVQTPEGFLFYQDTERYHWLPRDGFEGEADYERVAQLARRQVETFRREG